jgi:tRNA(Ile)-lysidine synthase
MLNAFLTFVNEHSPDLSRKRTLLAVSGGVDSVVMAELFFRAQFPFAIAHCNFRLRGNESDADEQFVRQWASEREVEVFVRNLPAKEKADISGISIQMAARDLRYQWFQELRETRSFNFIATAHHINDAIETLLLNLTRGTGMAGLTGISIAHKTVIRPLLFASKEQILEFARAEHIAWREDSSNPSNYYRRNLIRHHVTPILQKINPSLEVTFSQTFERIRSANALLASYLNTWQHQIIRHESNRSYIDIETIRQAQEPVYQLNSILDSYNYSYAQTKQIVAALNAESGKVFYSPSHQLVKDRTVLIISPRDSTHLPEHIFVEELTSEVQLPGSAQLNIEILPTTKAISFERNLTVAYFDKGKITYPLTIRPWQQGDWFCPFGMKGKRKKVSDLLIDHKVPLPEKSSQLVLLDHKGQIVWVLGVRSDERFRIEKNSETVLCMKISHNNLPRNK